jgi:hypothetical protein
MVNEHTVLGVAPRAMRGTQAALALLVACCVALVAGPAFAAPAPVPFADNNNNGVFDAGDTDITEDLKSGFVVTSESLVLPDKMKPVTSRDAIGFTLIAGKNVTLGGDLNANGAGAGITIVAESGHVTLLDQTRLRAAEYVYVSAGGDLTVGAKSNITASTRSGGVISLNANNNLVVMADVRLQAQNAIDLTAVDGNLTVYGPAHFLAVDGSVAFNAGGDIVVNGSRLQTTDLAAYAGGHLVDFQNNRVNVPYNKDGWMLLYAAGSTINVTGSTWTNLPSSNVMFIAPEIIR